MRNLTKTLAVVSLLAPASAQPLGIGDLKLHSALNQKLNAEINLLVSADDNPAEIQVRMAPPEKFDEAGVPWSFFLSKIKFNTVVKPNGAVIVKLSSNEALQEPFLDFLLEVTWTKGNLYREFTVLIDPPVAYEQPVIPVVEQASPTAQLAEQASPVIEKPAEKVPVAAVEGIKVDSYGPTNRSDTLWKIAEKIKPAETISTEQMMLAIYEANPRAFFKDNVNALMAGQILDIPDNEAIVKLSKQQAAKLFSQQTTAWKTPVKQAVAEKPTVVKEEPVSSQLELVAPVEAEVADQVVVSPEQEQGAEETDVEAVTEQAALETQSEQPSAEQGGDEAMQSRLEKLEKKLEMMQKLLTLKDEQLADLQNKQQAEQTQPAIDTQPQARTETAQPEQPVVIKPQPQAVVKPQLQPTPTPTEPESGLFADSYYLLVGGLGFAILGGLGWLWWRQRNPEEHEEVEESMFASSSEIRMPDSEESTAVSMVAADDASAYDVGTVGESSFLSEFTPSDFDAFDSDMNEVDPISEADVYLAYGRYQQAEELMRQAIVDEPTRNDCKLKLLEIFYANENKDAFEDYVRELVSEGKQNDHSFWNKVLEMGNEIIQGSDLLAVNDVNKADFTVDSEAVTEQLQTEQEEMSVAEDEDNFDLSSFGEDFSDIEELRPDSAEDESNNDDLDFDLSAFAEPATTEAEIENHAAAEEQIESVEFDLGSFAETEVKDQRVEPAAAETEDEIDSFDFNAESEQEVTEAAATELDLDLGEETDEKLESFDFSSIEESMDKMGQRGEVDEVQEDEEFDFNFDFDDASLSGSDLADKEQGVSDLTDMDEFETKIDLAKAYIDMGDADAAKSIVEEVLEKGNDQQKQVAQSILAQLD